ncbi:MAG: YeeE/YedE family protein [Candidatus Solibacter usitatus]|nr:YeeE/YedE family protein [Candidatus Solibacter usitatus]
MPRILLGLLTGFLFGFLLQKGRVSDRRVIVGQFLLRDFTVMKVMLTAIVVGGAGVYAMHAAGLTKLFVKPAQMAAVPVGGLIFGVGMVLLGYCPGTAAAAAGEGKRDAWLGLAGMVVAAAVFAEMAAGFSKSIMTWANLGPVTLPDVTGVPAWVWLSGLAVAALFLFRWLERKEAKQ